MQSGNFRQGRIVCTESGGKKMIVTEKFTPNYDIIHFKGWAMDICGYTENHGTYYPSTLSQETTREIILTKQQ